MNLSDILLQVDTLVPNSLPVNVKVMFLNQLQHELFRDFFIPDKRFLFSTAEGDESYPLPADCDADRIKFVMVDKTIIMYQDFTQPFHQEEFWTMVNGELKLFPTPAAVVEVELTYTPSPVDLTESDMNTAPALPDDYHHLFVYGIGKMVAMSLPQPDQVKTAFCSGEFDRLSQKARFMLGKPKAKRVQVVRSWV